MSRTTTVWRLGRVEYADGLTLMDQLTAARRAGAVSDNLLLLEHEPVLTLGRGAKGHNVLVDAASLERLGVERFETDRGGDVTYHGPGQLVGYPLLFLEPGRQDVRKYVRSLEEVIIRALADFGVEARRIEQWPGVWVEHGGPKKVCALGVHLSRWYTRHGFALNVAPNLAHFGLIVPCGISQAGVTSMEQLLGRAPPMEEVEDAIERHFAAVFETSLERAPPLGETICVALVKEGKVLLLERTEARGGFWQLVTGRVEPGERPEQAAAREVLEETGLAVKGLTPLVPHAFALGELVERPRVLREHGFVAEIEGTPRLSEEHGAMRWATLEEAMEVLPFAGLKRAAKQALRR